MWANDPEMAKDWEKKKETLLKIAKTIKESLSTSQAKAAHDKFKKTGELPPHLKKLVKKIKKFEKDAGVKNIVVPGLEWMSNIKEADLGLTYKKGKTVKVRHKKSGKSLVIIDKPNVKKEYEKIGYYEVKPIKLRSKSGRGKISHFGMESVDEGKWSKIMTSVRKGSKSGPWSIVIYQGKKVIDQKLIKILQQIPAYYETMKKKYPNAKIGIEDKNGARVYTESVKESKFNKILKGRDLVKYFVKRFKYTERDAIAVANRLRDVGFKVPKVLPKYENVNEAERDYKAEYKKYGSSKKAKKYRAELNQYNRKKGTYGNGDGKDASHKNGKIVGFEKESKNRGRAEKSRLKKESMPNFNPIIDEVLDSVINEYQNINEGVNDPGIFKAIFLAGGPGSGKTFVSQKLFGIPEKLTTSAHGLKLVNQDTEFEMLLKKYFGTIEIDKFPPKEFADLVRSAEKGGTGMRQYAKALNTEKLRLYAKGRLGVIIDGTAHKVDSIRKKKTMLEKLGYDTYMVFVNTSLEAALARNEKRERTVPVDVATKSWKDVQNNMGKLQSVFKANFQVVDNSDHLEPKEAEKKFNRLVKKGIDQFMKKPIKNKIAKDWVKKQKILKKQGIKENVMNEGTSQMMQVYKELDKKFKKYDHTRTLDFNKVSKYLKTKFSKGSALPDTITSFYHDYRAGDDVKKNINKLTKYAKKMKGYAKESVNEISFSRFSTKKLVTTYKQMADERLSGAAALTFRLIAKELIKRKAKLESVNEKVIKVSKKDDVPGNAMKMSGEEKIKKLTYSGSNGNGSYEIKGKNLNVNGIRPRDKGFFVRHFTMKTGFRKANLYYDGVSWMDKNKKF